MEQVISTGRQLIRGKGRLVPHQRLRLALLPKGLLLQCYLRTTTQHLHTTFFLSGSQSVWLGLAFIMIPL